MGITIDKAIELLQIASSGWPAGDNEDYYTALELGIEALKRCKYIRTHPSEPRVWNLEGETKE